MYYIKSKIKSVELRIRNGYNMLEYSKRYEPSEVKEWKDNIDRLERRKKQLETIYKRRSSDNWYKIPEII